MSGQAEVGGIPLAIPFGLWPCHKAANAHAELGAGQMAAGALPANISQPRTAVVQVLGTCPLLTVLCHRLLACQKPLQDVLLVPRPIPPEELCPPSVVAFPARSSSMGAALCDSSARPCWLCPLSRGMCRWGTGRWAREAILHGIPSSTPSVCSPAPARGS